MNSDPAYLAGLRMLARRELTERQVRERLARRGHEPDRVDEAIARLRADRALDDARVARALAHSEVVLKRHGRLRAQRQLESAGIAAGLARSALDDIFSDTDDRALIEAALARRLRGGRAIADETEFRRLYRYLLGQGFDSQTVLALLRSKRRP